MLSSWKACPVQDATLRPYPLGFTEERQSSVDSRWGKADACSRRLTHPASFPLAGANAKNNNICKIHLVSKDEAQIIKK